MTMLNNFLNAHMKRYFTYFLPNSILALVFLIVSNSLFAQTTLVEWNFDDADNIADGGLLYNQSKVITSESRTNYQYFTGFSGQSISLTNCSN